MDEALDKAVRVFCERGYHATSVADLTTAMELALGSLYKAFKDKRAVFLAAFDRYKAVRDVQLRAAIDMGRNGFVTWLTSLQHLPVASRGNADAW
jgi:TetR/AcrR family transcriptional regulator, transcriptional repressor for nem operon